MNYLILLLLASILHSGYCITCYTCSSDENGSEFYDPDCATSGYDGHSEHDVHKFTCFTDVYEEGTVERHFDSVIHEDGQCFLLEEDGMSFWRCYCVTDLCNSNNCQHCHGETTQGTTPAITATITITDQPAYTTTSALPSQGLTCYDCLECSTVDDSTNTVTDDSFQSCTTVIIGSEMSIMRYGNYGLYPDGECIHGDGGIFCYCTTDLCNNGEFNLNYQ